MHRDAVWNTGDDRFGTFRGHLEIGAAWDDIFEIATDCAVSLREVVDCGGDRVFAAVDRIATAKGSGIRGTFPMFALIPVQNGVITRLDEYMDRSEALEAVGLGE